MFNTTKIYIIDFDDSFTFNIASVIHPYQHDVEILNFKFFFEVYFDQIILKEKIAIILGPGPGHPNQYSQYFNQIKILLIKTNIYLMGVCLGHQMIASLLGYPIIPSNNPTHGERIKITWKNQDYFVQRYNSLAVKSLKQSHEIAVNNEVMILDYKNGRSYQFHPESVGTERSIHFFKDLLCFVNRPIGKNVDALNSVRK